MLKPKTERILYYLESAEAHEADPWIRDDYRIAWITVLSAEKTADIGKGGD